MSRVKKWLTERFLPVWCREELLRENAGLRAELERALDEGRELRAYIAGMHRALGARRPRRGEAER